MIEDVLSVLSETTVFKFFYTMILWYLKSLEKGDNDWEIGDKDTELPVQKEILRKMFLLWFKDILEENCITSSEF